MSGFADMAAPLHDLTPKYTGFRGRSEPWSSLPTTEETTDLNCDPPVSHLSTKFEVSITFRFRVGLNGQSQRFMHMIRCVINAKFFIYADAVW